MISVIICSIDSGRLAAVQASYVKAMGKEPWELVAVRDAKSLAEGYQRGVAGSKGEIIVCSHDDIEVLSPDLPLRIKEHLGMYDMVGVAGTTLLTDPCWFSTGYPHIFGQALYPRPQGLQLEIYGAPRRVVTGIQAIDGLFMAMRREIFSRVAFDAALFDGFHLYDVDLSFSAYHAGLKIAVANDINLMHNSAGDYGPVWETYAERFRRKWGAKLPSRPPRKQKWAGLMVDSKAEAVQLMWPPCWGWRE